MYGLDLTFRQRDLPDKKKEKPRLRFRHKHSAARGKSRVQKSSRAMKAVVPTAMRL